MPPLDLVCWSARWIGSGVHSPSPNTFLRFRKQFTLDSVPVAALCRVAADSKYWLYVNGRLVVREGALKRGPTPSGTYYDSVDVAAYLRAGRNTLAVLIWYWGADGGSHRSSGSAGLLLQLDADGLTIATDRTWRVSPDAAFGPSELKLFNNVVVLSEWPIHYDARLAEDDWTGSDFDDGGWPAADELAPAGAAPFGELHSRPIPQWQESELLPYTEQLADEGGSVTGRLPANLQVYPYLEVEAAAGETISIQIERDWKTTRYVTRAGRQAFEVPAWGNGHWVRYEFPAGVRLIRLAYRETGYAADYAGHFHCDDPALNALWTKSARTTYLNMRDHYTDCPDRERAQWPGDAVNTIVQTFYALDRRADGLTRKFLQEFVAWRSAEGVLWGPVPTGRFRGTFREFPGQSLPTVADAVAGYYHQTGDLATLEPLYPHLRDYLLRHYTVDPQSLLEHRGPGEVAWGPGTQAWYDWGDHQDWRLMDNVFYYHALGTVLELAMALGQESDAGILRHRRAIIEDGLSRIFWTGQGYRSPEHQGDTDDRGNAYAVYAGLARPEHHPALRQLFREHQNASVYLERFVLEAMCLLGDYGGAIARLKSRFARTIASSYSTTPEAWNEDSNHAWSGHAIVLLARHIAGITPTTPGYATYRVRPQLAGLTGLSITVPSVRGPIQLDVLDDGGKQIARASGPSGGVLMLGEEEVAIPGELVTGR